MSGNTFGTLFTVTTFGESHGPAIGCIVDGCPPGLILQEEDIQPFWISASPGNLNIQRKGGKKIRCRFFLAFLKVKRQVRLLLY